MTGGPELVKLLTQDVRDVTGGLMDVEQDAAKAAQNILDDMEAKRKKLGI